ncbi:MAG TPA: hypothetical protein DCQ64_02095 [Candidatus Rokubacteria bacterium]|nr:hypothetical protein [Candidatus Rokubacteria bacterium]
MYVELHARSAFSFLEGAALPEALAERAARLGQPALALLDRDGLYGAPRLYRAAIRLGITPLVGAELGDSLPVLKKEVAETTLLTKKAGVHLAFVISSGMSLWFRRRIVAILS